MTMRVRIVIPPADEVVTVAEAKAVARVTHAAEDAMFPRWIRTAREDAEHLTQRSIGEQTLELRLPAFPGAAGAVELPRPPVTAVVSVSYRDAAGATQTLAGAGYVLRDDESGARLEPADKSVGWPDTDTVDGEVVVRYVAGYTPATVPASVADFILLEVGALYATRESAGEKPIVEHPFAKRLLDRSTVWDI